jgi:probable F420-dependent oxidoreductase
VRVSLSLPTHRVDRPELISAPGIARMAVAAEGAGFDAVFVTEHPFPGDQWLASGGHHALDPFVALTVAATATRRVLLQTNLLILAYRNPFLAAKAIASLDVISGGRALIGVGAGYLEPEYEALGVDMSERNDLLDEALWAMRAAWAGGTVSAEGRHWRVGGNTMRPTPLQQPGPPIWVGGNSGRAMRRAVEQADGWVPMLAPEGVSARVRSRAIPTVAVLAERIAEAHRHAEEVGRTTPFDVAFSPPGAAMDPHSRDGVGRLVDTTAELAAAGVTFLNAGVPGDSLDEFVENVTWFGNEVLPAINDVPVQRFAEPPALS